MRQVHSLRTCLRPVAAVWVCMAPMVLGHVGVSEGFLENAGQWEPENRLVSLNPGCTVRVQQDGSLVLQLQRPYADGSVEARLVRLSLGTGMAEVGPALPGLHHFFIGSDPAEWITGARAFEHVKWSNVAPGVDVHIKPGIDGLDIEWVLGAGSDPADVQLSVDGGRWVDRGEPGGMALETALGELRLQPARIMGPDGHPTGSPGGARFRIRNPGILGIDLDDSASVDVVVTSTLEWSTFLGGSFGDAAHSTALSEDGRVAVLGRTVSSDFPVTPGAFDEEYTIESTFLWDDLVVAVLDQESGALQWATYLGGGSSEAAGGIGFLLDGTVMIGARTSSMDYPVTDGSVLVASDIAVTQLAAAGDEVLQSRLIGGVLQDEVQAMTVTGQDAIHIAGSTRSVDFPVTLPGFHSGEPGQFNVQTFVMRLDPADLSIEWSLLLGGTENNDFCKSMAVNDAGDVAVTIGSASDDLPLSPNALDTSGLGNAIILLRNDGTELGFSSFLPWKSARAGGVGALDPQGRLILMGVAVATDFPGTDFPSTPGAFQPLPASLKDGFVLYLDWELGQVLAATHLGGLSDDGVSTASVDTSGVFTVTGATRSFSLPVTKGAFQQTKAGTGSDFDVFAARLDPTMERLHYSTYLGGSADDLLLAAVRREPTWEGGLIVPVGTQSTDYPATPGAPGETLTGSQDFGVTHLTMLPEGVTRFGMPTATSLGLPVLGVGSWPAVGDASFTITCSHAPPSAVNGILAFSLGALPAPLTVKGAGLWLDPGSLLWVDGLRSTPLGYVTVPTPVPNVVALVGLSVYVQMFWPGLGATSSMAASNALAITVQDRN